MQRIIKFRGKRVDNGEWVYGDLYQVRKPFHDEITDVFIVEWRKDLCLVSGAPSNNHWWRKVDPATVGQFTGLTDKNGNEIYEGDVLSKEPFLKVTFENGGFCFSNDLLSGSDRLSQERVGRLSIIGNIHENPEICKG